MEYKKQVYHHLKSFASTTTIDGVPNLLKSKRVIHKLLWVLSITVMITVCFFLIIDSVASYFDFEVDTKIEYVKEQLADFPVITICPRADSDFNEKNLSKIIVNCSFNYDYSCQLNHSDYFEINYDTNKNDKMNICYRFNSGINMYGQTGPILKSTTGGRDDSLRLSLDAAAGISVWIHDAKNPPRVENENNHSGNMLWAGSGALTQFIIDRIIDQKLGYPYNDCFKDVNQFPFNKTIIDYIIKKRGEAYSQVNCLELCFDLIYLSEMRCNCSNTSLGNVWYDCYWKKVDPKCVYNLKVEFYKENLVEKCSKYCPLECDTKTFSVVSNALKDKSIKTVDIIVYYRSLYYTLITEQPKMEVFSLISNIGGLFGLFMGISFLSFIEFIELFSNLIFSFFIKY